MKSFRSKPQNKHIKDIPSVLLLRHINMTHNFLAKHHKETQSIKVLATYLHAHHKACI